MIAEVRLGWIGVVLELTVGLMAAAIRAAGMTTGQWRAEGPVSGVAFAVVFAAPGVMAAIGLLAQRPVMVGGGALACFPLAIVSIVVVPIWIPGVLLLIAYGRLTPVEPATRCRLVTPLTMLTSAALIVGAGALAVFGWKPYNAPGESGSYLPASRAALAIAVVAADLVVIAVGSALS